MNFTITMIFRVIFILILLGAILFFARNIKRIIKAIQVGKAKDLSGNTLKRIETLLRVAFAQSKMGTHPLAALLHFLIYAGFIIINLEFFEIVIDGIMGTHRVFAPWFGKAYPIFIGIFEILAVAVILACAIFLARRNILGIKRFSGFEMSRWPKMDANIILIAEIILMTAFLVMNTADGLLAKQAISPYTTGSDSYWLTKHLQPLLADASVKSLILIERASWWFHIVGVLAFLNFLPYSKHLHIIFAFPNVFYSKLRPLAEANNMDAVYKEVKIMLELEQEPEEETPEETSFGVQDLGDLSWKNILDSYTCTECGRCTAQCPANLTGKKLSPRKIIMDVRDRAEDVAHQRFKKETTDGKNLFSFISPEELWACTTCNQCTQECPVNIDHLDIILQMRRYMVMEENSAPAPLNMMFSNIENNGAPWQYPQAERAKWTEEIYTERED